jgi:predicted outer membrane protein
MKAPAIPFSSSLLALAIIASGNALAQQTASDTDKAFDAKVSQGGRYEVEASNLSAECFAQL